jgi:double-strand break repair protein MRE11
MLKVLFPSGTSLTVCFPLSDLPVFAIHGNHDDPTRDGNELLAALDLLSVTSLVNYFGRQNAVDKVEVSPILLQKGDTHVALYGMGSLRDERLNRMWQSKKVRFQRPGEGDWFSIFALHQNRDYGRGSKNCVHESMIPEWMDLIVWGHEHECLIEPTESVVGTFRITQPGSSVATSLTAGESIRKHVGFLDVRGSQFRMTKVPLLQVRTFLLGEVSLNGHGLDPEHPKIDEQVAAFLETEVKVIIREGKEKRQELHIDARAKGNDPEEQRDLKYRLEKPDQILVRLKVEHSGFSTLNNQRFGARFVGLVANPVDILLFHRKKDTDGRAGVKRTKASKALEAPMVPQDHDEMKIEDLIKDNLQNADKKLEIIDEAKMNLALDDFVSKEVKQAMFEAANSMLSKQQKKLLTLRATDEEEDLRDLQAKGSPLRQNGESEELSVPINKRVRSATRIASAPTRTTTKRKAVHDDDEEDDDFHEIIPSKAIGRPKRQSASRAKYVEENDDEDVEVLDEDCHDEEVEKMSTKRSAKPVRSVRQSRSRKNNDEKFGNSFGVEEDWSEARTISER